jgi:glutamate synthase (NADPH/NADH) large chain
MNFADQFHDACGMGLLAHLRCQPSHQLLQDAIRALTRMMHRGAIAADGKTGDGCGLLCAMPTAFMRQVAAEQGVSLPESFAVATLFLSDPVLQREQFAAACTGNDLQAVLFREVPLDSEVLGDYALARLPQIVQAFVVPRELTATRRFDALLYLTRKELEHALADDAGFYVAGFSRTLLPYKGLVTPKNLAQLYPDLTREEFTTHLVLFHQRFSTNTLPQWRLAQPFRNLAHNGEINSIRANRFNAAAKAAAMASPVFTPQELERILPIVQGGGATAPASTTCSSSCWSTAWTSSRRCAC